MATVPSFDQRRPSYPPTTPAAAIRIFDTTLRDGEQSPGALPQPQGKTRKSPGVFEQLGVDIIEAGFPISSDGDFESVKAIAAEITGATIAGLARCTEKDVRRKPAKP